MAWQLYSGLVPLPCLSEISHTKQSIHLKSHLISADNIEYKIAYLLTIDVVLSLLLALAY